MAYTPVSGIATQYSTDSNELASGYWLKFYISNTSTPLSMATDYTGDVLLVKCKLNTAGFPITDVGDNTSVFIPYVNQSYRLVIFRTEADADANNTAAALVNVSHVAAIVFDSLLDAAVSSAAASAVTASTKADESAASAASIVDDVATATAKANEAAASASAAASSESAAATSETNAGSSETAAAASAAAASSSETASATSETNAAASAASVLQAEIDAAASAAAALSSENNSATSETNAAASASAALSSESAASTSETNATNAASAASTSETNALASKNAAAISATDAQASADSIVGDVAAASGFADAAQASYDEFVDIYHGALSSAPTTNLDAGDLYFDIPTSAMRVYDGALWRAVTTVVEGVYAVAEYTNIATQTTITTAYDVGLVQVLYNGVQLNLGDFTATNGTSIVLAVAVASATDVITVIRWGAVTTSTFLGTAATLDTGTAAGELPTNADLATGAFTTVGTAATANVQTSATDTTANALMKVGAFGLGTSTGPSITNLDTITVGGFYAYTNGATGAPIGDVGTVFHQAGVNAVSGSLRWTQFAISKSSGKSYTRTNDGGTILPWNEVITADAAGNVGIGTSSPNALADLHVADTSDARIWLDATSADTMELYSGNGVGMFNRSNSHLMLGTNNTERVRIDSSGNLLVAKTSTSSSTAGIRFAGSDPGYSEHTRSGNTVMYLNRLSSDGTIMQFAQGNSAVGSIGANAETLYVSAPQAGGMKYTYLNATNAVMMPVTTTGADADAVHDLGYSAARFKDLYLSGGVVFDAAGGSGTGSSNTLDEYEIGTFTPTSPHVTLTSASGSYVRVGDLVHFSLVFILPASGSGTGVSINGLPFDAWNNNSNRGGVSLGYYTFSDLTSLMSVSDTTINFFIGSTVQSYSTLAGVTFYMGGTYRAA